MLQEMRGKFLGGLFFGALGGIAGFLAFAVLGALLSLLFNALMLCLQRPALQDQIVTTGGPSGDREERG